MMRDHIKDPVSVFAFLIILYLVPLGHIFTMEFQASIVWPAVGFVFAFLAVFGKKTVVPLASGLFIGYLLSNLLIMDYTLFEGIALSVIFMASAIGANMAGIAILRKASVEGLVTLRNLLFFLIAIVVIAALTGTVGSLTLYAFSIIPAADIPEALFVWFFGDLFSLVIFGATASAAFHADETLFLDPSTEKGRHEMLFYLVLLLFAILLFQDLIPFLTYTYHKFLFFPFAIYAAYRFQYRGYYGGALVFLTAMALFPPLHDETISYFYYLFDVNLFLVFAAVIYFTIRTLFDWLESERRALEKTNERLNNLIQSMDALFTLSAELSATDDHESEALATKTFRIIFNLFDTIDYGSCMIVENGKIKWIDTVGYDKFLLNKIRSNAREFQGNLEKPVRIRNSEQLLKEDFGESYEIYRKKNPPIKESVFMSVNISKDFTCEMSFDIAKGSSKTFTESILSYFESVNILLNGFFESQQISYENDEKRTGLVTSLLKIIELFDDTTYQHSLDVAYLAEEIAQSFGLDTSAVNRLYWAGIVHDIGKIGIPTDIVNKPSTLTHKEYDVMKSHAVIGANLLKRSETLRMIAAFVESHHERYDGKGYPEGKEGGDLILDNYILSISEAVASMARAQDYSEQLSERAIIEALKNERDKAWPAYIVDEVVTMIENGLLQSFYQ